jgi:hypothetical protein
MPKMAVCFSCDIDFDNNLDMFVQHMSDHHADDRIQCALCDQINDNGFEYSMHFMYKHVGEDSGQSVRYI